MKLHWLHMSSPHLTSKYLKSVRVWEDGHCHPPSWWLIKDMVPSICRPQEGGPRIVSSELEPGACFPGASGVLCAWSWKPRHLHAAPAGPLLTSWERSLEPVRVSSPPWSHPGLVDFLGLMFGASRTFGKKRHHPPSPSRTQNKKYPEPTSEA